MRIRCAVGREQEDSQGNAEASAADGIQTRSRTQGNKPQFLEQLPSRIESFFPHQEVRQKPRIATMNGNRRTRALRTTEDGDVRSIRVVRSFTHAQAGGSSQKDHRSIGDSVWPISPSHPPDKSAPSRFHQRPPDRYNAGACCLSLSSRTVCTF